jgi:hypothetical protein
MKLAIIPLTTLIMILAGCSAQAPKTDYTIKVYRSSHELVVSKDGKVIKKYSVVLTLGGDVPEEAFVDKATDIKFTGLGLASDSEMEPKYGNDIKVHRVITLINRDEPIMFVYYMVGMNNPEIYGKLKRSVPPSLIAMKDADIEELYGIIPNATKVIIVDE